MGKLVQELTDSMTVFLLEAAADWIVDDMAQQTCAGPTPYNS